MNKKQIKELWVIYKKSQKENLKNKLIEHYLPFVRTIAEKMYHNIGRRLSVDELASFGLDGLYSAIQSYDISRDITFETFSRQRIWGSMIDNLRKEDWVPRSVRINSSNFEKKKEQLQRESNFAVYDDEVLLEIDNTNNLDFVTFKKYKPLMISSLDVEKSNGECLITKDCNTFLVDKDSKKTDSDLLKQEFFDELVGKYCSQIEQNVIKLYYYEGYTMRDISKKLKLSESRISQIHKTVLLKLKKYAEKDKKNFTENILSILADGDI